MKHFLKLAALLALLLAPSLANAAACTWSGGTGNWDNSNTASWSCGHVPVAVDTVTFDGTSGGGTVTVCGASTANCPNGSGVVTVSSITAGAFTGTLDFATRSPNVTFGASAGNNAFSLTGTGARTVNFGSGTFTFTNGSIYDLTTTTSGTFSAASATLVFGGAPTTGNSQSSFIAGGQTYGTVTINSRSATTSGQGMNLNLTSATITTLNVNGPVSASVSGNFTATNLNITGSGLSGMAGLVNGATIGTQITITCTSASVSFAVVRNAKPSCAAAATNTIDLGGNDFTTGGGSITPPSAGGGGGRIIGG